MNAISHPIMNKGAIEFFAQDGEAWCFVDGEKMLVSEAPVRVHQMIRRDIEHHPGALQALESMNITDPIAQHEHYTMCMHGELNFQPDFIDYKPNALDHEFTSLICGVQHCAHRGILCQRIHGEYGNLTNREADILHLIGKGQHPSDMAQMLEISITTVRTHIENIKSKIGVDRLSGIAIFATQNKF